MEREGASAVCLLASSLARSAPPEQNNQSGREGGMELAYECKVNGGEVQGTEVTDRRQVH